MISTSPRFRTLIWLFALYQLALGFQYQPSCRDTESMVKTRMGLFDFIQPKEPEKPKHRVYQGMSKKEEAIRKKNTYQGPKITIREDEDNAMWIETKDQKKGN